MEIKYRMPLKNAANINHLKTVKIMEKNLILTCEVSDFLQVYCGTKDSEEQFRLAKDSLLDNENNEITDEELMRFYHELVEIRVMHYDHKGLGTMYDDLLLTFCSTLEEYSCSCINPEQVLKDIISVNFK